MIKKRLLVPKRLRRPPREGWSWVDRRFLREHAASLSREGILLYFFLAAVSDRQGLSHYRDSTIAVRLRLGEQDVVGAREELIRRDLVAFEPSLLTGVLSLPQPRLERGGGEAELIGDTLRRLKRGEP